MKTVILAAGSGERFRTAGVSTPKPLVRLGGLSLLERTIRTAAKAGATDILIVVGAEAEIIQSTLTPRLTHLKIQWILNNQWQAGNGTSMLAAAPYLNQEPALVLMTDHVIFADTLRRFWKAAASLEHTIMAIDSKLALLSDPDDATKVRSLNGSIEAIGKSLVPFNAYDTGISICRPDYFTGLAEIALRQKEGCSHSDGMRKLAASKTLMAWDIGPDRWEDVDTPAAFKAAETLLMQSLRKPTDGFMSKHLERYLSGWITRRLIDTPITPNQVTLAVIAIGMGAAFLFSQPGYWAKVAGALTFWCASFLDGCDGEIARLKFMETRLGGWLDLWADNLIHMAVFLGIGVGLWRDTQQGHWLWLGAAAALGVLVSVGFVSWKTLSKKKGDGPLFTSVSGRADRLSRLADALSRRDFIFVMIFIALFEWLPEFLWAAAVGSHAYWMILLTIYLQRGVLGRKRIA
jgi:1L-myo-inositol 1-phosphate cytidylyltransferase / CDP-L-myo-inositol myo-inositolphosphotransferase